MNETERKQDKQQGAVYSVPVSEDVFTTQLRLAQRGALKTMKKIWMSCNSGGSSMSRWFIIYGGGVGLKYSAEAHSPTDGAN